MSKETKTYFQFRPELNLPVFVSIESEILLGQLTGLLDEFGFEKCSDDVLKDKFDPKKLKLLKIVVANPQVAKQIGSLTELDKYGAESLTQRVGYSVYRFKGTALLVHSEANPVWEMGLTNKFHVEGHMDNIRVAMNRFLSFVLAIDNIIGFWGAHVDEGMVVMKQSESRGEAIFVDFENERLITMEGIKPMAHPFQILKLDSSLQDRMKTMKVDELVSFLTFHCTYMSVTGMDYRLKRQIMFISQFSEGIIYPEDNFKPRKELVA